MQLFIIVYTSICVYREGHVFVFFQVARLGGVLEPVKLLMDTGAYTLFPSLSLGLSH